MSATGEFSSRRISLSTAARSSPTSAATRSFRTCSTVGVGTADAALLQDDAVADLDLRAGGDALHLGHGKALAELDHPRRRHFLVELAKHLAGDGMHDGNAVTAQADHTSRLHAV